MPSPPSLLPLLAVAALALAPATAQRTATAAAAASRPTLTLYGEALCPDTAAYVTRVLAPLLDSGLVGVRAGGAAAPSPPTAEFRFVGYGNAKGRAPGSVKCQHGKEVTRREGEREREGKGGAEETIVIIPASFPPPFFPL